MSNIYTTGLHNVGPYQAAGYPFVQSSGDNDQDTLTNAANKEITFPGVTSKVVVWNNSAGNHPIRVHFLDSSSGNLISNNHFYTVDQGEYLELDVKCTKIFLSAADVSVRKWSVFASITSIPSGRMYALTGSGIDE